MQPLLLEDRPYSFSELASLPGNTHLLLQELGYRYRLAELELPRQARIDPGYLATLLPRLRTTLDRVSLDSEMARREFLVAPLLSEVVNHANAFILPEFPFNAGSRFKGSFDYLLRGEHQIIIVEAKRQDLESGMKQLAGELISVAEAGFSGEPQIYGAVTIGTLWKFAVLDVAEKMFLEDLRGRDIPEQAADVIAILAGLLNRPSRLIAA